MEYIDGPDL